MAGYQVTVTERQYNIPIEETTQEEVENTVIEVDPESGERKPKIIISHRNVTAVRYEQQPRWEVVVSLDGEHLSTSVAASGDEAWDKGETLAAAHREAVINSDG